MTALRSFRAQGLNLAPARMIGAAPGGPSGLVWIFRLLFLVACVGVGFVSMLGLPDGRRQLMWDKADHFVTFYGLAGLSLLAFPRGWLWALALFLVACGIGIEVAQGLVPALHRDCDVWDVFADACGIAGCYAPLMVAVVRRQLAAPR